MRALDTTNGEVIWEHARPATTLRVPSSQSRGIALYNDSVIVPTVDNHVLPLDMKTCKLRWDHLVGKPENKLQLTAAPLIAHGKVIQACLAAKAPSWGRLLYPRARCGHRQGVVALLYDRQARPA